VREREKNNKVWVKECGEKEKEKEKRKMIGV